MRSSKVLALLDDDTIGAIWRSVVAVGGDVVDEVPVAAGEPCQRRGCIWGRCEDLLDLCLNGLFEVCVRHGGCPFFSVVM